MSSISDVIAPVAVLRLLLVASKRDKVMCLGASASSAMAFLRRDDPDGDSRWSISPASLFCFNTRAPHGSLAPMVRVGQGSTSNCSIADSID